ncbi:ScbA/BarX family gamma-butyrolactone biosynthesis protein [Streptomyces sp. NPDC041068]|uniref:ScbA/BarX family gamma-butyrolactone biosynthesis protein n=1 Tax=Streptomyces sp. NPDC041068 TaxID=3155130 RepID=UPI0033EC2555
MTVTPVREETPLAARGAKDVVSAARGGAYDQTVPRQFVHRSALSEVFLTGASAIGEDAFLVSAQWPRAHSFFTLERNRRHDPMLVAETVRQIGLLIAHTEYAVPLGHKFLMWNLRYEVSEEALRIDGAPSEITGYVTCHDVRTRGGKLAGMRLEVELFRGGIRVGGGGTSFHCTSPAAYGRLRPVDLLAAWTEATETALPAPVEPALLGRDRAEDVTLAPSEHDNTWHLRADTCHPVLFDHAVDHVPGMAVMEAMRQAAQLAAGPAPCAPVSYTAEFAHYVEFDSPCAISAQVEAVTEEGVIVTAQATQDGRTAASGRLVLRPTDRA